MNRFAGKTAVVTGAASGIGRALALTLARAEMELTALDVDEKGLSDLSELSEREGLSIKTAKADVTSEEALRLARDQVLSATRHIDLWVNNAGVAGLGGFMEQESAAYRRVLDINLHGVIHGSRIALEVMEKSGHGTIVNMASIAGHLPAPFMSAYNASKHGVVGFTRSLQQELRLKDSPVRMVLVSPGFCDTRILNKGGEGFGFPDWLGFLLSTPERVAEEILVGLKKNRAEIYPTLNGRMMKRLYTLLPNPTVRSSKILLTKSWKDLVFNRYNAD